MEKEFVPYELAVKLKSLGFHEHCFGYYYTLNGKDWKFIGKTEYHNLDDEMIIGSKFTLLAPLYQQAFRWFREKGFLIDFSSHNKDAHDFYFKWSPDKSILSDYYGTYEEAELACLQKMVEIVENNLSN